MKKGVRINLEELTPEALGIEDSYRTDIFEWLLKNGYVKGFKVRDYINGRTIMDIEAIDITPEGILYLKDNSTMKKVLKWLKTAKEITPRA